MGRTKPLASGEILRLEIDGFYCGKWWKDFQPWRLAIADMIGADISYSARARPFLATRMIPDFTMPEWLDVLEADTIGGAHECEITPAMRAGDWPQTPHEPLLILLLISLPGRVIPARHADAIVARLVELDSVIHALDDGRYTLGSLTHVHDAAIAFFTRQAEDGKDVPVHALYTDGRFDFDTRDTGAVAL